MTEVLWKNLAKDIDDLTKISDEIDADLVEHNEDPSAHGQTNEAIEVHRVGEILDHLNGSTTGIKLAVSGKVADAIVAASGGDYTDIQSAIDAGKKAIFVKRGTYSLDADIVIPSDVSIFGEDKYDTIIDLNGDHQIKSVGDTPYITGTITATNGSAILVGSGTLWLANLAVNDFIVFHRNVYKITAVTDNTHITVDIVYKGKTKSLISYNAGTFKYDVDVSNFTISGHDVSSAKGAVYLYGVVKSHLNNLIIKDNDLSYSYGVYLDHSFNNVFFDLKVSNNGSRGISLNYSDNNILSNIAANNNGYVGLFLNYSDNNILSNITANSNNNNGIYLQRSEDNTLSNIITNHNNGNGFVSYLSHRSIFSNITANFNNTHGFSLVDNNHSVISNVECNGNGSYGVYLQGSDDNVLSGMVVRKNDHYGILLYDSNYNVVSGNKVMDNSQAANNTYSEIILAVTSTYNIISNNNIRCTQANKSAYGIREDTVADDWNLVHGNTVRGAVTAQISLQGVNSVNADNI